MNLLSSKRTICLPSTSLLPSLPPSFYPSPHLSSLLPPSPLLYLPHTVLLMFVILPRPAGPVGWWVLGEEGSWRESLASQSPQPGIAQSCPIPNHFHSSFKPLLPLLSWFQHVCSGSKPPLSWFHTTSVLVPDHFCPDSRPLFCYDLRFVAAHYVARRLIYPGSLAVYNLAVGTSTCISS